jgi:hypothetical protein
MSVLLHSGIGAAVAQQARSVVLRVDEGRWPPACFCVQCARVCVSANAVRLSGRCVRWCNVHVLV